MVPKSFAATSVEARHEMYLNSVRPTVHKNKYIMQRTDRGHGRHKSHRHSQESRHVHLAQHDLDLTVAMKRRRVGRVRHSREEKV